MLTAPGSGQKLVFNESCCWLAVRKSNADFKVSIRPRSQAMSFDSLRSFRAGLQGRRELRTNSAKPCP